MISYTLTPKDAHSSFFAWGFKEADTNDVFRIARGISQYVWSACIWEEGRRRQNGFLLSDWCALDFEDPDYPLAQAQHSFCDCIHIIGTTRNHQVAKDGLPPIDRFRVLIPWERRISDLAEFRHNMRLMTKIHPIDPQCIDGARFFFPCTKIISINAEGYTQPVKPAPPPRPRRPLPPGGIPMQTLQALRQVVPAGRRNTTFYGIAKDLARAGISEETILVSISTCPTYQNKLTPSIIRELETTVKSAVKSVQDELAKTKSR